MFEHQKIRELNDFFVELNGRPVKGVYFYRINAYSDEIRCFIRRYYEEARKEGVIVEGKIQNPTKQNLSYYDEIMGMDFQMDVGFISSSLKKWLPRMNDYQRANVSSSIYNSLSSMQREGKNENILKNAYIKFMCWLYYKFERIVNRLGENRLPKILYEGAIGHYELMLISILSNAGCDVILLQYSGDATYLELDKGEVLSDNLVTADMKPFPKEFSLKRIRKEIQEEWDRERLYGIRPDVNNCTNAWITGEALADIKQAVTERGEDPNFYYNCYCRINGVQDKLTYVNELYQFQLELKHSGRFPVVVEGEISAPSMEEISQIKRGNYRTKEQMLMDLSKNLGDRIDVMLQRVMVKSFIDVMLEESQLPELNLNKLMNRAVYLLCWSNRYQDKLFSNWKMPEIACFIHMGRCENENEALFLKYLARLPVDVLILNPDRNKACCLKDKILYEVNYSDSLTDVRFPSEDFEYRAGTAAYHAERELDSLLYQDSGLYREYQYSKANSLNLQTMYEEIKLLWNEELKYRPNFSTVDDIVNLPVIFAKISGVKNGNVAEYWRSAKELINEESFLIKEPPHIASTVSNPIKAYAVSFWKNGRLQRKKIRSHREYPYSMLREETQDRILDKLQALIDSKLIRGTFENGTEYTIIATVLNLEKDIVRLIQKFDFTKKNPKLIYFNTKDESISLEDTIMAAFLNLMGFDVIFFVPTGYQSIEKYFTRNTMEEHRIGEYMYDLEVPSDMSVESGRSPVKSWRERLFGRGV